MKVRVYFCKESDIEIIIKGNKIGRQALDTIYDLVWRKSLFISLNLSKNLGLQHGNNYQHGIKFLNPIT
jgi:hypothetical protein